MMSDPFPAILIAGPPHSGKSVLGYLLSQGLRDRSKAHYLLRAVPDGEGDWYLEGDPGLVRTLRFTYKSGYTSKFTQHMRGVIQGRLVPLLVDVGGLPRGEQFDILKACTHAILLHRSETERREWMEMLAMMNLKIVADMHSSLEGGEQVSRQDSVICGTICGLERDRQSRKTGLAFQALLARIEQLCQFDEAYLEQVHAGHAPFPFCSARSLAEQIGLVSESGQLIWRPEHLVAVRQILPKGKPYAIYGRGPVWLAAGLAIHSLPAEMALFDIRFGWLPVPEVSFGESKDLQVEAIEWPGFGEWMTIGIRGGVLEPGPLIFPEVIRGGGIVLSGKLPRWAFAALARKLSTVKDWIGIDDPGRTRVVVVQSNHPLIKLGTSLQRQ